MSKGKQFVLSDESLNRYGFRVMTDGIDTTDFEKNPVMFFNHNSWDMPIGRWEDLQKKDGKLIATAVFDEDDELGKKVADKVDKKILGACSIGFDIAELSNEAPFLVQGQTRPTVSKSMLLECSIVGMPANVNAIRLSKSGKLVELSGTGAELSEILPELTSVEDWIQTLGFKNKDEVQKFIKDAVQKEQDALIELGKSKGIVTAKNEAHFRELAAKDPQTLLGILKNTEMKPMSFHKTLDKSAPESDPREKWSFDEWSKNDPKGLLQLKNDNPEKYKELIRARS